MSNKNIFSVTQNNVADFSYFLILKSYQRFITGDLLFNILFTLLNFKRPRKKVTVEIQK